MSEPPYEPLMDPEFYKRKSKISYRFPDHPKEDFSELIDGIIRRKDTHTLYEEPETPEESEKETIVKITFICGCHGQIIGSIKDLKKTKTIESNGTYSKTSEFIDSEFVPSQLNKVTYITKTPALEFEYTELDTSRLNVFLSTSGTCAGGFIYRPPRSAIIKQKLINDVLEELTETCPMNPFTDHIGKTTHITHKTYNAIRKFQKMYREKSKVAQLDTQPTSHPVSRKASRISRTSRKASRTSQSTCIMNYENEKVEKMINKIYVVKHSDVYGLKDTNLVVPTGSDAHKLVMIVTKSTSKKCVSEKYVLLSNVEEVAYTREKLRDKLSLSIAVEFDSMLSVPITEGNLKGTLIVEKSPRITLQNLLKLGAFIIQEINGPQDLDKVPIKLYDLSCNNFGISTSKYDEASVIRIIDHYIRMNNVACGKRKRRKSKKNVY